VVAIVVGSALAWGTVHPVAQAVLALAAGVVGLERLGLRGGLRLGVGGAVLLGVLAWMGLLVVPVPEGLRQVLQPGVQALTGPAGGGWRPLAVDPRGAVLGLALLAGLLTLGLGLVARPLRPGWTSAAVVLAGLGVLASALATWGEPGFGVLRNPNHAGVLLALGTALAAVQVGRSRRGWRLAWAVAGLGVLVGAVLTGSRAAVALAALGGILVGLTRLSGRSRRVGWGVALVGIVLAGISAPLWFVRISEWAAPGSTSRGWLGGREAFFEQAWRALALSPAGAGPGAFATLQPAVKQTPDWARAAHVHCDPLELLLTLGPLALVVLGLLVWWAWRARRSPLAPALLVLGLAALIGFPLHIGTLAVVGVLLLARVRPPLRPGRLPRATLLLALAPPGAALLLGWAPATSVYGPVPDRSALQADPTSCAQALRAHPLKAEPRLVCALLQDAPSDRIAGLQAAHRLDPTHPLPAWALARQLRIHGQPDAAARAFVHALSQDLPPRPPAAVWLTEALRPPTRDAVLDGLVRARPARLCAHLSTLAQLDLPVDALAERLASRSARCALYGAEWLEDRGQPERALAWLQPWPVDCGRQRLGARLTLSLDRPAQALEWLAPADGACLAGDAEVVRIRKQARERLGL